MANWSSDTYIFGRFTGFDAPLPSHISYCDGQQETFAAIRFDRPDLPYMVDRIKTFGPGVEVIGYGKYGCGITLTDDSWAELCKFVVYHEYTNIFQDEEHLSIVINGELVLEDKRPIEFDEEVDEPRLMLKPWARFQGRTPQEQHYFAKLYAAIDKAEKV